MGKVNNKSKYLIFFFTGLFLGGMVGVIIINLLVSYRIDNYIKQIQHLNTVIEEDKLKLERYQEAVYKKRLVVKEIKVDLMQEGNTQIDDITKIALEKHIKNKFKGLIGKEVDKIDGDVLCEIIDKRIMKLEGKEYQLKINKIMISEKIKLWITVRTIK